MKAFTARELAALRRAARSKLHIHRLVPWLVAISPGGVALGFLLAGAVTRDEMLLVIGLAFLLGGVIPVVYIGTVIFYEGIIQKLLRVLSERGLDLEGFSLSKTTFEEYVPHGDPEGEAHERLLKRQPRPDTGREQGDRSVGSQTGPASISGLSPWEMQLIERARNCNIYSAKIITGVSLFFGMLLGATFMVLSLCYGWRSSVIAAALWLGSVPIFCYARWMIITLFHIIQQLTREVGQTPQV